MMRGLDTTVRKIRRRVFEEVARLGFEEDDETLKDRMEEIPYEMVQEETQKYRDSVYRARAIVRERMRLAMGLSLRPQNRPSPLTSGVEASNISDKYYEPPLIHLPVLPVKKEDMRSAICVKDVWLIHVWKFARRAQFPW